jgi:hypothetical protein
MALREILHQTKPLAKCVFVATEPVVRYQNIEFIRRCGSRSRCSTRWI